jgi:hypothetical protein
MTAQRLPVLPNLPPKTLLRITSIFMLVCATIGTPLVTYGFLLSFLLMGMAVFVMMFDVISAWVLGIFGVISAGKQARARIFIILGVAALSLRVVVMVASVIVCMRYMGSEYVLGLILFFVLPSPLSYAQPVLCILYIIGGFKLKKAASAVVNNIENQNP